VLLKKKQAKPKTRRYDEQTAKSKSEKRQKKWENHGKRNPIPEYTVHLKRASA
jgi:hypothetical protein